MQIEYKQQWICVYLIAMCICRYYDSHHQLCNKIDILLNTFGTESNRKLISKKIEILCDK